MSLVYKIVIQVDANSNITKKKELSTTEVHEKTTGTTVTGQLRRVYSIGRCWYIATKKVNNRNYKYLLEKSALN